MKTKIAKLMGVLPLYKSFQMRREYLQDKQNPFLKAKNVAMATISRAPNLPKCAPGKCVIFKPEENSFCSPVV